MQHSLVVKVYLDDTDAQGVVYHTNYLKYCERGRTDMLALCGYELGRLQQQGCLFVVYEMRVKYQRPARLHDELEVISRAKRQSDYRVLFEHQVLLRSLPTPILQAEVTVVAVDENWKLRPLPEDLLAS